MAQSQEEPRETSKPKDWKGALFHPMLSMAPVSEANQKNGRKEWAVLLCKLAWLRFNNDWDTESSIRPPGKSKFEGMSKQELKEEYGVAVLVYSYDATIQAAFEGYVCAAEDFTTSANDDPVVSVVFDPTLPENRFPDQVFQWVDDLDGDDGQVPKPHRGTMLRSILVPTLLPEDYDSYITELLSDDKTLDTTSTAEEWLSANMPLKVYKFRKDKYYTVNNTLTVDRGRVQSTGDSDEEDDSDDDEDDEDYYDDDDPKEDGVAKGSSSVRPPVGSMDRQGAALS